MQIARKTTRSGRKTPHSASMRYCSTTARCSPGRPIRRRGPAARGQRAGRGAAARGLLEVSPRLRPWRADREELLGCGRGETREFGSTTAQIDALMAADIDLWASSTCPWWSGPGGCSARGCALGFCRTSATRSARGWWRGCRGWLGSTTASGRTRCGRQSPIRRST